MTMPKLTGGVYGNRGNGRERETKQSLKIGLAEVPSSSSSSSPWEGGSGNRWTISTLCSSIIVVSVSVDRPTIKRYTEYRRRADKLTFCE